MWETDRERERERRWGGSQRESVCVCVGWSSRSQEEGGVVHMSWGCNSVISEACLRVLSRALALPTSKLASPLPHLPLLVLSTWTPFFMVFAFIRSETEPLPLSIRFLLCLSLFSVWTLMSGQTVRLILQVWINSFLSHLLLCSPAVAQAYSVCTSSSSISALLPSHTQSKTRCLVCLWMCDSYLLSSYTNYSTCSTLHLSNISCRGDSELNFELAYMWDCKQL